MLVSGKISILIFVVLKVYVTLKWDNLERPSHDVLRFTCFGTSHHHAFRWFTICFFEIQWDGRSHVYVQSNYVNT